MGVFVFDVGVFFTRVFFFLETGCFFFDEGVFLLLTRFFFTGVSVCDLAHTILAQGYGSRAREPLILHVCIISPSD